MPSYDIKTYVRYSSPEDAGLGVSTTVLIFVDSKSNLAPAFSLVSIPDLTTFSYYFGDDPDSYSPSLATARRILESGYSLLAINVRECYHKSSIRISKDIKEAYFPVDEELASIPHSAIDTENLAVSLDISSFTNNSYVLLQQTIKNSGDDAVRSPYVMNTLIYTTEFPPIPYGRYTRSVYLDLSKHKTPQEICRFLRDNLMYSNSYFVRMSPDYSRIYIASRYSFDSISIFRNVSIEYDKTFEGEFLSRILKKDCLLDIYSTYETEFSDLEVSISRNDVNYTVQVNKYSSGTVHTSETFKGTVSEITELVNNQSTFIRIDPKEDYFPLGTFRLQADSTDVSEITDADFEKGIDVIYSRKKDDKDSFFMDMSVNIVYEPDVYSIRSQALINDIFDSVNCPVIKFLNYLGIGQEIYNPMAAYFDCCNYTMSDGTVRTSKELYLTYLINATLGQIHTDILDKTYVRKLNYPNYVNRIQLTPTGYSVDRPICFYDAKRFDVLELLPISLINKVIRRGNFSSQLDMYSAKNMVNSYCSNIMGFQSNLDLAYFLEYEGFKSIGFSYRTTDKSDISLIELILDARQ